MATVEQSAADQATITDYNPDDFNTELVPLTADSITNPDADNFDPALTQDTVTRLPEVVVTATRDIQTNQVQYDNPLHDYENYTYNLSWHILSTADYNNMVNNPDTMYIPKNCLVASGGKNTPTFARNPFFTEDFYFEEFKLETVVNLTRYSRNSNAISFDFTVIENNGFTLINRLIDATTSVGGPNYLKQPYLLVIEFTGYKDGRITEIKNQTKYLPFALVGMQSSVTAKGVVYKIQAAPYNHQALSETTVVTPAIFKVQAKTPQDLLCSLNPSNVNTEATIQTALAEREKDIANLKELAKNDPAYAKDYQQSITAYSTSSLEFNTEGLCDGLNNWLIALASDSQSIVVPNQYRVVFDKEIGQDAKLVPQLGNNINNAATPNSVNKKTATASAAGKSTGSIDFSSGVFTIKPGTNIMSVIDYAVRNSTYVTDQLIDPLENNVGIDKFRLSTGKPLNWYKVVPKITISSYDSVTNRYGMNITYYVKKWTVNAKNPYAPLGRAAGYVKRYDYLFTGKNRDIIDMKLDFDTLFYIQLTSNPAKNIKATGTGTQGKATKSATNSAIQVPSDPVQPISVSHVSSNQTTSTATGPDEVKKVRAGDTTRDITQSSRGDMVNIQIRIIGDPHFIKQDDIFYGPQATTGIFTSDKIFVSPKNQSMAFDRGELYVYLNFQSPNDYNDATGLAIPGVVPMGQRNYQYSAFSGIFKIITVTNEFRNGKFEQILDLARLPISDQLRNQALNIQSRFDQLVSQGLGQLITLPPARFTGPLVLVNNIAQGGATSLLSQSSGGGGLGGILQGLVSKVVSGAMNKLIAEGTNFLKGAFDSGGATLGALTDGLSLGTSLQIGADTFGVEVFGTGADVFADVGLDFGAVDVSGITSDLPFDTGFSADGVGLF